MKKDKIKVNYKTKGSCELAKSEISSQLHLEPDWTQEGYVFGPSDKSPWPINSQVGVDEYKRLSRELNPDLAKTKLVGKPKDIYSRKSDPDAWWVMDVTDTSGKVWQSIAGWTRLRTDKGEPPTVILSLPEMMRKIPGEVDHTQSVEVSIQEYLDIEATFAANNGIPPNDNPKAYEKDI